MMTFALAAAAPARSQAGSPARRPTPVLDIEKLAIAEAAPDPNRILTCDVLIVGGGLGGVAAAEALADRGRTVILTEPTSVLGGQLTAQAVSAPDENSYIEQEPGVGTRAYRLLRQELRDHYAGLPGIRLNRARNVGQCWVSRISGEPQAWARLIDARLESRRGAGRIREVLTRHQVARVSRFPHDGRYHYADFVHLDTGRITRVAARYMLDATETGDVLPLAGLPWRVGAEARSEHGEPHAPEPGRPEWVQSFTYCFLVRWQAQGPWKKVEKPAEYESFKALGEYTLGYDYIDRGRVYYQMHRTAPGAAGPFWTYRRLVAASSFDGNPEHARDLALINWRGNDFHEENPIGKPLEEQVRILKRAREFARGFLYWLQNECPRDEGGTGYPEIQLAADLPVTVEGFGIHPYVRESRRLVAEFMLKEQHLAPDPSRPDLRWQEEFPDTVGTALYSLDIHPAKGEPPFLSRALPYHIPLGSFVGRSGPYNVLPAAKNFGGTRLALSSARMHPTEWLIGEVAGNLAAYCLEHDLRPAQVRADPEHLRRFQAELVDRGVSIRWRDILPPAPPGAAGE